MNQPETKADLWTVIDTNAKTGPRLHEIPIKMDDVGEVILTKPYRLDAEVPTQMEENHAMFFLKDQAFIVRNPKGEHIKPVVKREGGMGGFRLDENEVIAEYEELSKEALYKRCKVLAGSEGIKETRTPKEEMVAFLKERANPARGRSPGSESVIGEMAAGELDSLLAA